jgi:catechol 2,3-dioxygenase-like lactoylglutathione lyase family enzyme
VITGAHTIIYASDAAKARAFFKDVLGFPCVDAGRGWLIFALRPPNWPRTRPTPRGANPAGTSCTSCAMT